MSEIGNDNNDVLGYVISYSEKNSSGNLPIENNIEYIKTDGGKCVMMRPR